METNRLFSQTVCLSLCFLTFFNSCQKDDATILVDAIADTEEFHELQNRISSETLTLSEVDAVIVAGLFAGSELSTKSHEFKTVKDVDTINDASGVPAMYAVNYTDGYILVSATKNYYPIIAEVDHGSFQLHTDTGQDILLADFIQDIEYVNANPDRCVSRMFWLPYERKQTLLPTKANGDYYDLMETYLQEWYDDGRNVYYLYDKPETMPDDTYEYFCQLAMDDMPEVDGYPYMECAIITEKYIEVMQQYGPMLQTKWKQGAPFNSSDPSLRPLGCVTVAVAQIMKYHEFSGDITFDWDLMPNLTSNSILSDFMYRLRGELSVSNDGGSNIYNAKAVLEDYGYNCEMIAHDGVTVRSELSQSNPLYMRGYDSAREVGHAWVCDGYQYVYPRTEYSLYLLSFDNGEPSSLDEHQVETIYNPVSNPHYYHMNWGWGGSYDGYFVGESVRTIHDEEIRNYTSDRYNLRVRVP